MSFSKNIVHSKYILLLATALVVLSCKGETDYPSPTFPPQAPAVLLKEIVLSGLPSPSTL